MELRGVGANDPPRQHGGGSLPLGRGSIAVDALDQVTTFQNSATF